MGCRAESAVEMQKEYSCLIINKCILIFSIEMDRFLINKYC